MNKILLDESYSIEDRFEMAKVMLEEKERTIKRLKTLLNEHYSTLAWTVDQLNDNRMGL